MNNSFDIFDKIYCIHLPQHTERLTLIQKEFAKFNMNDRVTYIHATPPQNGFNITNMRRNPKAEFGVNLSQIKAIVHAIHDNAKQPFFCEDDIVFDNDAQTRLNAALTELPNDWELLYLGGHPRGNPKWHVTTRYSKHLAQSGMMSFADSYTMRKDTLIHWFNYWVDTIGRPKDGTYDFILGDFSEKRNAYCVYPIICTQRPGYSYIGNKHDDKREFVRRGWTHHLGNKV